MLPVSQILDRNIALFDSTKWLVVNPEEPAWLNLCSDTQIVVLHQLYSVFQECTGINTPLEFNSKDIVNVSSTLSKSVVKDNHTHIFAPFVSEDTFDNILICIPKSKAHLSFLIEMASARLAPEGQIYLVGENRSGIKSLAKLLKDDGVLSKVDSARHCTLMSFIPNKVGGEFNGASYVGKKTYSLDDHKWFCSSFPGVFSDGKLDAGTALLLNTLPIPFFGHSLDFACGAGVISAFLMTKMQHLSFDLLDVSAPALFAAAHTMEQNGLSAKLFACDGLIKAKNKYQNIVTNPPFHTGIHTDYQIVNGFLEDAAHGIKKGGKLFVVANRFLPYLDQLKEHFQQTEVLKQDTRFSVYSSY